MKNLHLQAGGEWLEILAPTPEQTGELESATPPRRREIFKSLRKPADAADVASATAIYEKHKVDGADLIACDIAMPSGSGIINCRVGGDHEQIRF